MTPDRTAVVEQTLAAPDVHERWERIYHSPENARFFDLAIPRLVARAAPGGDEALDAKPRLVQDRAPGSRERRSLRDRAKAGYLAPPVGAAPSSRSTFGMSIRQSHAS